MSDLLRAFIAYIAVTFLIVWLVLGFVANLIALTVQWGFVPVLIVVGVAACIAGLIAYKLMEL